MKICQKFIGDITSSQSTKIAIFIHSSFRRSHSKAFSHNILLAHFLHCGGMVDLLLGVWPA